MKLQLRARGTYEADVVGRLSDVTRTACPNQRRNANAKKFKSKKSSHYYPMTDRRGKQLLVFESDTKSLMKNQKAVASLFWTHNSTHHQVLVLVLAKTENKRQASLLLCCSLIQCNATVLFNLQFHHMLHANMTHILVTT